MLPGQPNEVVMVSETRRSPYDPLSRRALRPFQTLWKMLSTPKPPQTRATIENKVGVIPHANSL
jgi:hypothetical protein